MNKSKICDAEARRLNWLINFKLPNYWKKIGIGLFSISIILFISTIWIDGDLGILKKILKSTMLFGLLIVIISKEKIEDEWIESLRSKAFSTAFIFIVLYVLAHPIINYIVSLIAKSDKEIFRDLGDFQILWLLMILYLTTFLSSIRKAK